MQEIRLFLTQKYFHKHAKITQTVEFQLVKIYEISSY